MVIGAGMGGLAAATDLAASGREVLVLERAASPGGKMRRISLGDLGVDGGPTVFTMKWVFEGLFADAGACLEDCLTLEPAALLARHAWSSTERLDLFVDQERSAEAIAEFAGAAEARGYLAFCARAQGVYRALEEPFIRAQRPGLVSLAARAGPGGLWPMIRTPPFRSLWAALGEHFKDQRLRQLFGRYATYVGASPFLAPATLMLIAHVEQAGVWYPRGGMHALAVALETLAKARGAKFRYGAEVTEIQCEGGRVSGVRLADGERIAAAAVVCNADVSAIAAGAFGDAAALAQARLSPDRRSLSAMTWVMATKTAGFPLVRHNVFFSRDYAREFHDLTSRRVVPTEPTVYVCAQDREDASRQDLSAERLLVLINAPARGDEGPMDAEESERASRAAFGLLARCGLELERDPARERLTDPAGFEALFPFSGGALYGRAVHGWRASFQRGGARARLPGLYLAGGGVHPGAGVPMAALSGRRAAAALRADGQ